MKHILLIAAVSASLAACTNLKLDAAGNDIWTVADCQKAGGTWTKFQNASGGRAAFEWCE